MRIVLLGPPGAGKGTQAAELISAYGIPHISTGEIFRSAFRSKDDLGLKAQAMIERGELVSDGIVIALVVRKLASLGEAGWLLDGFPRTIDQAAALDEFLDSRREKLDAVVLILADSEEIIGRLKDRRVCVDCGATYHLRFRPSAIAGQCDLCGGELYQRTDDRPATIRKRLEVYEAETRPLVDYYDKQSTLVRVDGNKGIDLVMADIKRSLDHLRPGRP
jgi:adenylate kinase